MKTIFSLIGIIFLFIILCFEAWVTYGFYHLGNMPLASFAAFLTFIGGLSWVGCVLSLKKSQ